MSELENNGGTVHVSSRFYMDENSRSYNLYRYRFSQNLNFTPTYIGTY